MDSITENSAVERETKRGTVEETSPVGQCDMCYAKKVPVTKIAGTIMDYFVCDKCIEEGANGVVEERLWDNESEEIL